MAEEAADHLVTSGPVRTCIGCRERGPQRELLRFVALDAVVTADPGRRLPGRGAWLHDSEECRARAAQRGALARALRLGRPL